MWAPPPPVPPADLVAAVSGQVAGLDLLKRRLAVTLHRHHVAGLRERPKAIPNIIVLGGSGAGKTHTLRAMLAASGLPFVEAAATAVSDVGYVGPDLSSILTGFVEPPWVGHREPRREMIPLAERFGVVVIDEFDKLRSSMDLRRDQGDRQKQRILQSEMLRMVEGDHVLSKRRDDDQGWPFWTGDMLFIASGAFQGLNGVVEDRLGADNPRAYMQAQPEDIARYGFLDELVGRFSTILALPPLDPTQLARILAERLLPAYGRMAADDGLGLTVTEPAALKIASLAAQRPIGARALAPLLEAILWRPWHDARPGQSLVVDVAEVDALCARLETPCLVC